MTIGARFRQLRLHLKLSGEQIGGICGVSKGMVSQWESDSTIPPVDRLIALAGVHEFSIDWVLLNKGQMIPNGVYITDPKLIAFCGAMEPVAEYVKDAAVDAALRAKELAAKARENGGNNGTHG
ncbi:MAG: helix-turn-helix domain-containing protein [Rhodocyclales bacterium]|nr:helix-turn-helix domain-containing protein [Rhodocyclales bacterium]